MDTHHEASTGRRSRHSAPIRPSRSQTDLQIKTPGTTSSGEVAGMSIAERRGSAMKIVFSHIDNAFASPQSLNTDLAEDPDEIANRKPNRSQPANLNAVAMQVVPVLRVFQEHHPKAPQQQAKQTRCIYDPRKRPLSSTSPAKNRDGGTVRHHEILGLIAGYTGPGTRSATPSGQANCAATRGQVLSTRLLFAQSSPWRRSPAPQLWC